MSCTAVHPIPDSPPPSACTASLNRCASSSFFPLTLAPRDFSAALSSATFIPAMSASERDGASECSTHMIIHELRHITSHRIPSDPISSHHIPAFCFLVLVLAVAVASLALRFPFLMGASAVMATFTYPITSHHITSHHVPSSHHHIITSSHPSYRIASYHSPHAQHHHVTHT